MLKNIHIKHFTIITELDLELNSGLTVLTGETGAGKSILIDALALVLGERADTSLIQQESDRCEITAIFDVTPAVKNWLAEQDLDNGEDCFIRRVLSRDGRSRSAINGRPCSLQEVRELGSLLVQIHGQNQHTQLLKNDYQRELLDNFAQHLSLCEAVQEAHRQWKQAKNQLAACLQTEKNQGHEAEKELLSFQIQELSHLGLGQEELTQLALEHQNLARAEDDIRHCRAVTMILSEDEQSNVLKGLHLALQQIKNLPAQLQHAGGLLEQALIQTQESLSEIQRHLQSVEPDPQRLFQIEERLGQIHNMARKHKIPPEQLLELQQQLSEKLQQLSQLDGQIQALTAVVDSMAEKYKQAASQLSISRQQAAAKLGALVSAQMRLLGMADGEFTVQASPLPSDSIQANGNERIEFLVTTNKGQVAQALNKVASGGEISRISLALQVLTSQTAHAATLIFDEIDVGIGGSTAEIVGQQLKLLGQHAQVLCVTHQPQVAAKGDHHLQIKKQTLKTKVMTQVNRLKAEEKIQEIARMLGGVTITEKTLAHAKEMLEVG